MGVLMTLRWRSEGQEVPGMVPQVSWYDLKHQNKSNSNLSFSLIELDFFSEFHFFLSFTFEFE